jgi:hypothetical protein
VPRRLKHKNVMPPGGVWQYRDPDLDQIIDFHGLLDDFPREVNKARIVSGHPRIPEHELYDLILAYVCDHAPQGFCIGHDPKNARVPLSISQITNFTRTLSTVITRSLKGEKLYAEDALANAAICVGCPKNRKEYCSSCTGLESVARALLRQTQTTPLDNVLGACEVCGCMLRVKVHYSPETIREATHPETLKKYPDHCWIVKPPESGKETL